jgi:hypothetical protein
VVNNKKICISLISDDKNIIENQIIAYILGNYKFTELKTNKISTTKREI